jgi:hypothetical protein
MNATLGEIALNHALTHETGPVPEVLIEHVEGAVEAIKSHEAAAPEPAPRAPRATEEKPSPEAPNANTNADTESKRGSKALSFKERAHAMIVRAEELTRENPRKALAIAAGAGLVLGISLLSVPVLRTVAKRAALGAIKGGGVSGLGAELGGQALEKVEQWLAKV